jgi:putative transposase
LRPFRFPGQRIEPVPVGAAGVLAGLHQRHRRDLAQPCPLGSGLGQGDDPALHFGVGDLLPGAVCLFPQPERVVEHHAGTPERPGQHHFLAGEMVGYLAEVFGKVCEDFGAVLAECNGEDDHVHLLVEYPPKVPVAALVNSLKGVSARRLRQRYRVRTHREHLWSPSYFAASCGGAPLSIIRAYVENQRRPD